MKKNIQSRMTDNYTSMSWGRGDKLYASDLTKMSRQVDSNENELVDLTTTTIPKIVSDIASHQSTLDEFAPKVAKIDVPEGSTIGKEIDKAVADLVNGAPETLDTIKEVADAIEQNSDTITALNELVTTNKAAIEKVDSDQKATAEKLADLDQVAVKYQSFQIGEGSVRKTVQLANYDSISGVTTDGRGINLAMVSKWDKADFGSAQIETNLNSKNGVITINDTETIATVKQIDDAAGQINTKFEGKLELVNNSIEALGTRLDTTKSELVNSIDSVKSYTDQQLATKQPVGDYPEYREFSAGIDPAKRKTIQLANADSISGVTTDGRGYNLAMVSKWNKADLGSAQIPMNLNSLDGEVTINDGKIVATTDDIVKSEAVTSALIDKKISDYHKENDIKFVTARTPGEASDVLITTVGGEGIVSSIEHSPVGAQAAVSVGSQLVQVMTNYKGSDRQESSAIVMTPTSFELKRRDHDGTMHVIEVADLIDKAKNVPTLESGLDAAKTAITELQGVVDSKTPLSVFDTFKTETNSEIQKVKGNVLQLSNSVYTKSEIDGKLAGAFHYKGSVATFAELPSQDVEVGDVWNVAQAAPEHNVKAGDNVAWNGVSWDVLSGIVDLNGYDTIEQVAEKIAVAVAPKADKEYVDAELVKKVDVAAFNDHNVAFDAYKEEVQGNLDTKAEQAFVIEQLNTKVSSEKFEQEKVVINGELAKKVDKETYNVDKGILTSEINNKVSNATFEATNKEIQIALDEKQPAGSYVNKPEFDSFAEQYQADKATFAPTTVVDEKLATKADKIQVTTELAKKAEKVHTHVIGDVSGLAEALGDKVTKDVYSVDKATFAVKTEVEAALGTKADIVATEAELAKKAVKADFDKYVDDNNKRVNAKVEQSVYDAHVENITLELSKKLSTTTHEAFVDTMTTELANKVDLGIYNVDKPTFALKDEVEAAIEPLATKEQVKSDITAAIASVYRYKGSVASTDLLPVEGNVTGDVWNVESDGANVAWDGEKWDKLGGPIDLSAYATIESVDGKFAQEVVDRDAAIKVETDTRVAAIAQLEEQLNANIDTKLASADFDSFKTGQYKTDIDVLKQADADEAQARQTLDTKFETFKTETYEPKVAELANLIGEETSARQNAIAEVNDAFKTADEKVTGEYTKAIEAAKTEVTTKVTEVESALNAYKGSNDAAVAKVETDVTEAFGAADQALEDKVTQGYTTAVEGEKVAREAAVALLATKVELEGVNTTLTGKFGDYYTKGEVDGKFAGKADKVHTHTIENITGLQDALDGKQAVGDYALKSEVKTVDDKFAGYTTTEALNGLLDDKAAVVHTHTVDNVTGLQAALDAKMAASEAAKFAAHDHNHDSVYLAIGGKAESAKVADSVAWANVTGTEGVASKEDVAGFAATAEVAKLSGEVVALKAMVETLQAQVEGMKFKDVVPQAPQADIKGNDVVVSAGIVNADTPMKVTATNNAKVEDVTIESSHATVTAKNDVSLSNVTLTGDLNKNTAKTNAAIKVNTEGHVTINGVDYRQTGYNAIEVGLNTQPKSVIIDSVDVDVAMNNNAFNIFGCQKDGVVTISNCHVKQCSNPIRVSNVLNVPFTINVVNCKFDKWDTNPEWQGMMIFQDHNAHSAQEALERKAFAKINVNLINCIGPDGQKIEGNAEQLANNNIIYVWNEHQNRVGFDVEQYPVVNAC